MIGRLRHPVEILKRREVMAPPAATSITFETIYRCFAQMMPVSGYVSFDTKQLDQKVTHKIRIRYHANVTTENWLLFNAKRFRIRSVVNVDERNRWLDLLCEQEEVVLPLFETGKSNTEDQNAQLG